MATITITKDPSYIPISPTVYLNSVKKFTWNSPSSSYADFSFVHITVTYDGNDQQSHTATYTPTDSSGSITISSAIEITDIAAFFKYSNYARTVTLNANGGTISSSSSWSGSGSTATKSVNNGSTYGTLPSGTQITPQVSDTVKRSGYYFNGWYTSATGGTNISSGTGVLLSGNQTIYANWAFSMQFNANGGTGGPTGALVSYIGGSITIPLTQPTRSGYNFDSWNTAANGSGTRLSPGQTYSGTNVVLYAQWSQSSNIKVYTNNQWVSGQVKVYKNGSWQNATIKEYNGTSWV